MKLQALLLSSLVLGGTLFAQMDIQIVGGKNYIEKKRKKTYNQATTYGIRTNFYLSKNNALQVAYDRLKDPKKGSKDANRYSVNYMGIYNNNNSIIHPFVLVGGGYENGVKKNQGFMNVGIGAQVELTQNLHLVGEIKGIKKNKDGAFDVNTNIGVGYSFAKEPDNDLEEVKIEDCKLSKLPPQIIKPKPIVIIKQPRAKIIKEEVIYEEPYHPSYVVDDKTRSVR